MKYTIVKLLLILAMSQLAMAGSLNITTAEKEQISDALAKIYDINGNPIINKLEESQKYGKWEAKDYIFIYKTGYKSGIFLFSKIKNPRSSLSRIEQIDFKVGSSLVIDATLPAGLGRIIYSGNPSGTTSSTTINSVTATPSSGQDYAMTNENIYFKVNANKTASDIKVYIHFNDGSYNNDYIYQMEGLTYGNEFTYTTSLRLAGNRAFKIIVKDLDDNVIASMEQYIEVKDDSSTYTQGIDVSRYQNYIDWSQVARDNVQFAYIKATEGYMPSNTSEAYLISLAALDSNFRTNVKSALSNGIFTGLYHFARPDLNRGLRGAENEAMHFVRFAKDYYQNNEMLPPVIDVENSASATLSSIYSSTDLSAWVRRWLEVVTRELGMEPIVYTYSAYSSYLYGLNSYDLWIAKYPLNDGKFRTLDWFDTEYRPTSGNWSDWKIWQYTSQGASYVDGVNSGGLDRNIFRGTLNALKQWAKTKKN